MKSPSSLGMNLSRPAANWRHVERRQWWLSSAGILVSLVLTLGIISFVLPAFVPGFGAYYSFDTNIATHALTGMVLIFDVYVIFQQVQIYRFRKQIAERE